MSIAVAKIQFRGQALEIPAANVCGRLVGVTGKWIRTAKFIDEEWQEEELVADVAALIREMRKSGLSADILSFAGPLGSSYSGPARVLADNVAVIRTSDYEAWWNGLPQEARKNTRRAEKRGVAVRQAVLDDELARGIKAIYDETPIRQGRPFWHYGKELQVVKSENGTYAERAQFLGAYLGPELIGFMKWVRVNDVARIMQILCLNRHQDKRPAIALIAKAAEVCHERGLHCLTYGKFTYGKKTDSSITEFKRRLGFEQLDFPRYFVPLTLRGRLALWLGVQEGLASVLPRWILDPLLKLRATYLERKTAGAGTRSRSGSAGEQDACI